MGKSILRANQNIYRASQPAFFKIIRIVVQDLGYARSRTLVTLVTMLWAKTSENKEERDSTMVSDKVPLILTISTISTNVNNFRLGYAFDYFEIENPRKL